MNDKLLEWAVKIQSIAQSGLAYCKDEYDRERYETLRNISAEMLSERTDIPDGKIKELFCGEKGYQTPKTDTRAAIFKDGKILLVREKNGTWTLPGGWCEVNMSVAENTIKEVKEEAGLDVTAEKLIAVHDWKKHNVCNYIFGVIKIFILCRKTGGEFTENIETSESAYFGRDELPCPLATEKTSKEQIMMCFDANEDENWVARFE